MRKVRREIMRTINEIRTKFGNSNVFPDLFANRAANEYAEYLLNSEDKENPEVLKTITEKHLIIGE